MPPTICILLLLLILFSSCHATASYTLHGKMSTFGGPDDKGVSPSEGLAIYSSVSQNPAIFLPQQPPGTTGLARRLNPATHYLATRWDYQKTSVLYLRKTLVTVKNPKTGQTVLAYPADWGPNAATNRVADLSPGVAKALGLQTDDQVQVIVPLP